MRHANCSADAGTIITYDEEDELTSDGVQLRYFRYGNGPHPETTHGGSRDGKLQTQRELAEVKMERHLKEIRKFDARTMCGSVFAA